MNDVIQKIKIGALNIEDSFFDSLREAYGHEDFNAWLMTKQKEDAYVLREDGKLLGFLYLKDEIEETSSITPFFEHKRRLKIGTFKIDAHRTVLGQRFLSIVLRKMLNEDFDFTYVTLFEDQSGLIKLFKKFGFKPWGYKDNGELVLYKDLEVSHDIYKDFPRVNVLKEKQNHMLGIYPKFHTKLFPDSILTTETDHIVEDLSFTNTNEKIYLTKIKDINNMKTGDVIVIYRTAESGKLAEYSAVATTLCTVVEIKNIFDFNLLEDFLSYCGKGTIFTDKELVGFWQNKYYPYIIKMLYNVPLSKRIIRKKLIEEVGIDRNVYAGYIPLTDDQLNRVLEMGEVNESFIIN
ncbi:GNAT family N-acetyltransferase [Lactococcus petauri]|uniref:GNAT family N-acetyltransferase n=1 Tax=Lactococcus petauri TaxID=1940789 RepID=UPI0018AB9E07|nr:GNAT family N-acetyltransferase [Lactococcus petauri]MDC0826618.1 GNAT family N-acetyltransferase [Lactococcus petauri]